MLHLLARQRKPWRDLGRPLDKPKRIKRIAIGSEVFLPLSSHNGLANLPVASSSNIGGPTMVTETRETGSLIGSDKVEGTAVYGANDAKIGSIERVMIDKMTGKVSYAVLSFGGFLGIGDDHYPLLAVAEIRQQSWRLSHRHNRDATQGSA
jgi:hypothetical protein